MTRSTAPTATQNASITPTATAGDRSHSLAFAPRN